jgi:hypothetical protein
MNEQQQDQRRPKREWQRPEVRKIAAGEAEVGPNPGQQDGAFTLS